MGMGLASKKNLGVGKDHKIPKRLKRIKGTQTLCIFTLTGFW